MVKAQCLEEIKDGDSLRISLCAAGRGTPSVPCRLAERHGSRIDVFHGLSLQSWSSCFIWLAAPSNSASKYLVVGSLNALWGFVNYSEHSGDRGH